MIGSSNALVWKGSAGFLCSGLGKWGVEGLREV